MGSYDCPVWFRFVMANNQTVIYCAPLPYSSPVLYDGYDPVSGRSLNPSMSLEILPFQDQFANLLSQYILSTKQNLVNFTGLDTDVIDEDDIQEIEKGAQSFWSRLKFFRFSSRKMFKSQQTPNVVFPQRFPQVDTSQIGVAMKTILEILERVLVMSAQELGQAASHEQTREEVRNIASSTSTRAQFTASALDRSRQAWKQQIYEGLMAYGAKEGFAQVPADPKITPEVLSSLGFTWEGDDLRNKKVNLRFAKTAIRYVQFAANRDGDDRINDLELARSMGAFMQQLLANPMMAQAIGPDQFMKMANMIGRAAGLPRDFNLHNRGGDVTPEENNQQMMQQVQQMLDQAMQALGEQVQGALKQVIDENVKQEEEIQSNSASLQELVQILQPLIQQAQGAQVSQMPMQAPLPVEAGIPAGMPMAAA